MDDVEKYMFQLLYFVMNDEDDDEEFLLKAIADSENVNRQPHRTTEEQRAVTEDTVRSYSLSDFKSHFRVEKPTFAELLQIIGPALAKRNTGPGGRPTDYEKQILVSLWMLGHQEPLRCVSERFDLAKSSARQYINNVVDILVAKAPEYIKWPDKKEAAKIMAAFEEWTGFPRIVGAIGATHVLVLAPHENPTLYVCKKGQHSIILQGICDHNKKFIDCYAGMPGSVDDASVFRTSDIYEKLSKPGNDLLPNDAHLIGDSTYPLQTFLMKPFPDNGHLTQEQRRFNYKLSRNSLFIKHAYALLKGRFQLLKKVKILRTEFVPKIILACCVLHNFCVDIGDPSEDVETEETDKGNEGGFIEDDISVEACLKRDHIADNL